MSDPEKLSELSAYAYGFSDKKPGFAYWAIQGVMVAYLLGYFIGVST